MPVLRPRFAQELAALCAAIADVEGFLAPRDMYALALAAAHPTAKGGLLEIGAFRGKSTVLLSKAAALAGDPRISSCDPLTWSNEATPPAPMAARARFNSNLCRHGVLPQVAFYQCPSAELAPDWHCPLRLLWIDGDHSYEGVKSDLRWFVPHLVDGGMLLMHDVLSAWPGANRAFLEDVLSSPHFGPCGIHGNVAWAQYRTDPAAAACHSTAKARLARALAPLVPYQTSDQGQRVLFGWRKLAFKLLRARALYASPGINSWLTSASQEFATPTRPLGWTTT